MESFIVRDGEIRRNLSTCEPIYLRKDVVALVEHWTEYFKDLLATEERTNNDEHYKTKLEGALWALGIMEGELKN